MFSVNTNGSIREKLAKKIGRINTDPIHPADRFVKRADSTLNLGRVKKLSTEPIVSKINKVVDKVWYNGC